MLTAANETASPRGPSERTVKRCHLSRPRTPAQLRARWMAMDRLITMSLTDSAVDPEVARPILSTHASTHGCSLCGAVFGIRLEPRWSCSPWTFGRQGCNPSRDQDACACRGA